MNGSTKDDLSSPWTSGSWHFNPKDLTIVSPQRKQRKSQAVEGAPNKKSKRGVRQFGRLPENDVLRLGYIALFSFSGFIMALLAIVLFS